MSPRKPPSPPGHDVGRRVDRVPGRGRAGVHRAAWVGAKEREFLEDFAVIDLVLSRSFAYGRSLLRVSNLTDERYQAVRGVPQPGRWVSLETQFGL